MSRLIISFVLAFCSHLYLFQYGLDINSQAPPRLISDSSVSVTLQQNIEKQPNNSSHDPPNTATSNLPPQIEPKSKPKPITPDAYKIKETIKQPAASPVIETTPVTEVTRIEEVPKSADVETIEHNASPVYLKGASLAQTDIPPRTAASSSVIEAQPLYQYNPKPEYPALARKRGWQGIVMLLVKVTEEGEVASVRLYQSCGYKILDKSAVRAVASWRFIPGTRDGKQTHSTVLIPVHFTLER